MASSTLFEKFLSKTFRSPARKEQLAYLQSVPLRRLAWLMVAAFFLFATVGLLSSIHGEVQQNYLWTGFAMAVYLGALAVMYLLAGSRRPIWALAVIPFQVATTPFLKSFTIHMQRYQTPVSFEVATQLYAICALFATIISYTLFFRFIQIEGRYGFRARAELALAHTIQATLVPGVAATIAGCEIYGLSLPSAKVGGDLVDVVLTPAGHGFAYLVDVAGHGLNAGILMGMVKTAVRTCLAYESTPGLIFDTLNRILPDLKESNMYATCAALYLQQRADGQCDISYALAGHPPILHLSATGQIKSTLSDQQFPLGLLPFAGYQTRSVRVAPGDLLIAATDGILETCSKDGIDFGQQGLEDIAAAYRQIPLPDLAQKIFAAAANFGPQEDDRTLLLLRIL
jgi:serine phosphatase RsbU (regulator of sigma subunit)